jgi:two-component system response regulator YesN
MTPLEFLRSDAVLALLARAATGAGVPLSIHFVERNQEGARIVGWGQCAACRQVQSLPGGASACRLSRTTAASMALRQRRPMPFICHLGFACVSAPVLPGEKFVMTFGPFCPMEEQRSLEADIQAGFENLLEKKLDALPVSLDDIHRAPAAAVPAIAEWCMEALQAAWESATSAVAPEPLPAEGLARSTPVPRRRVTSRETAAAGIVPAIVAALAGGSFQQARSLLQGDLEELHRGGGRSLDQRRARVATLASAALEGLAGTGLSVEAAWDAYPVFMEAVTAGENDSALLDATLRLFSFLRRSATREQTEVSLPNYPELFALVNERLVEGVTLEEVAAQLGETPSAISHRLKRKFGMSFSDYVGRIRVDRAKRLFRETSLSVAAVGLRVGIPDQSNFARLFKKIEGMSPPAYRKQFGKQS